MMNHSVKIRLYIANSENSENNYQEFQDCIAFTLEREIYTPFDTVTATFPAEEISHQKISRISVWLDETEIFLGLVDSIRFSFRNQRRFLKIRSKSFTSDLTQNELPSGRHNNLTIHDLMENFYSFPRITYDDLPESGYIFVKSGNTMWDGVVNFGYKLTGHYPYVTGNHVHLLRPSVNPENNPVIEFSPGEVLEYGTLQDYSRMISQYHMSDMLNNTPDAFIKDNPLATGLEIVRNKHIDFDDSFRHAPELALTYRNAYSNRGCRADYLLYNGFQNWQLGDLIRFGDSIPAQTLCKVRAVYSPQGFRTELTCYQDGFYNKS
ncbi:MAG: hypothetical protein K2J71_08645 [Oscillospiraceae bacterium]|nr:hypothetical protein [Oscillospiraceae bacterium]